MKIRFLGVFMVVVGASALSCTDTKAGDGDAIGCKNSMRDTSYDPQIVAADFTSKITNKYLPFVVGTTWTYDSGKETIEVSVIEPTRTVLGIQATVVHDVVKWKESGMVLEDTFDWYAQNIKTGDVWYLGEDTTAFPPGGAPIKEGAWEAGVDCAKPGIVMKADPRPGDKYRQEYYAGSAEDRGEVVALGEMVQLKAGMMYSNCLKTKDLTDLEPSKFEYKYYCPDVGFVKAESVHGQVTVGGEELVSVTKK